MRHYFFCYSIGEGVNKRIMEPVLDARENALNPIASSYSSFSSRASLTGNDTISVKIKGLEGSEGVMGQELEAREKALNPMASSYFSFSSRASLTTNEVI